MISLWFDVQRTWSHLESIFIGSEDIRKQLPVDSQRFDEIDTEFKVLMVKMGKTSNVVKATNVDGLAEKLEVIQSQLSLCEKALAEYLETKRLAFPRFYFASSNDLLDILSNGNQPLKVWSCFLSDRSVTSIAFLSFSRCRSTLRSCSTPWPS